MTMLRARIATLFTWAANFFGDIHVNPILDQPTAESSRVPTA